MDHKNFQDVFLNHFRSSHPDDSLLELIVPIGKLSAGRVLEIYKDDYEARLLEALQENFEAIWFVIGDELFFELCQNYINANPSIVKDLRFYGHEIGQFIQKIKFLIKEAPFLSDLASFEIQFWEVFHQASKVFDQISFQGLEHQMDKVKFKFRSDVTFFSSPWNIGEIWNHRLQNSEFESLLEAKSIKLEEAFFSVFFKKNDFVKMCRFTENQYNLLKMMKDNGLSLEEVLEVVTITPDEIQNLFSALVKEEIPVDIIL